MMSHFRTTEISDSQFESNNLRFITVKSKNLKGRGNICVFVPKGIADANLPIVLLLHGVYGSAWSWAFKGGAHQTAQDLIDQNKIKPMILVMPSDGLWGDGSAYIKHSSLDFEKWIIEDVITAVKELIPQAKKSAKTFIAGLSMGGFGALRIGAKYSTIFAGISAHSAITELSQMELFVAENLQEYLQENSDDESVLKTILNNQKTLPPLRFDCGREDVLIRHNRLLSKELENCKILHVYQEFEGKHEWEYWQEHLKDTLMFFSKIETF